MVSNFGLSPERMLDCLTHRKVKASCLLLCLSHIRQNSPFVMKKKNFSESDDGKAYEGFCIDLLNALKGKLHFEYELHLRSEIGERRSDGTWSGMIGELTRKVGDTLLLIKYYCMIKPVLSKSVRSDWFFFCGKFSSTPCTFVLEQSRQIQNLRPKQRKKSDYYHS